MAGIVVADTLQAASTSTLVLKNGVANTPPTVQDSAGTQIGTFCRAWVNYKGTVTRAVNASFNVSSVTFVAVGKYTINFTTALPDANYAAALSAKNMSGANVNGAVAEIGSSYGTAVRTTTALGIVIMDSTTGSADSDSVNVAIFR